MKHKCEEHIVYDGEYQSDNDYIFFYGHCLLCGKRLVETFKSTQINEL